ncbi:hypothetical protein [Rhizobium sp. EC-SD404]|uniref:sulfotransferase family protein n=1 Tax=Rhizobium sp. EC-SD404 TaxID=2038389 RepID=UPI00125FD412|nr:hypothetical protein [Rhizobium sp. EC-SD404]
MRGLRRRAFVILGMHRSGTSALTRVLALLGAELPRTLVGAGAGNPLGHWESRPICDLNDRILKAAGSYWYDWRAIDESFFSSSELTAFEPEARAIFAEEFGDAGVIVLKDPRICRLYPFWRQVLDALGIEPMPILPLRHPAEVAASLEARDGMHQALGQIIWLRHVLDAERFTRHSPRVVTTFEHLLEDWQGVTHRIGDRFEVSVGTTDSDKGIGSFLSRDQRHHAESAATSVLPAWVDETYRALLALEGGEAEPNIFGTLTEIESKLRASEGCFAPITTAAVAVGPQARNIAARLQESQSELARLRSESRVDPTSHSTCDVP